MRNPLTPRGWMVLVLAPVVMASSLALLAWRSPALALINESPSLPRGLYLRRMDAETARGSIVAVPQPAQARAYLSKLGMPGEVLLIKRVAAVGGDTVCAEEGRLVTPGGVAAVRAEDRRGTTLRGWRGCRQLVADELFLLGDTAGSYDSRYFGPVRRSEVIGEFREIWTW